MVKTNSTIESHETAFKLVCKYYEKALEVELDKSGKDYSRLSFLSHDPDLYFNEEAIVFEIQAVANKSEPKNTS